MSKDTDILDDLDRRILNVLMRKADTPYAQVAKLVHSSAATVHLRLKKMRERGLVAEPELQVNAKALGYDISAFVGIELDKSSYQERVVKDLGQISEVLNAHYTTGAYNIFLRILCRDSQHLHSTLKEIQEVQGVLRTETMLSLEEPLRRPIKLPEDLDWDELKNMLL